MKQFRLRGSRSRQSPRRLIPYYVAGGAFLALAVALMIVAVMKSADGRVIERARAQLAERIQADLNQTLGYFDKLSLPKADVAGDLLPGMKEHLYAAEAMNDVLVDSYGAQYAVLTDESYDEIAKAISEVEKMIEGGQSTSAAREKLSVYMTEMEAQLTARFGNDGLILPRTVRN